MYIKKLLLNRIVAEEFLSRPPINDKWIIFPHFNGSCKTKVCSRRQFGSISLICRALSHAEKLLLPMALYFPLEIAGGHPLSWPTVFLAGVFYFSIPLSVLYQYRSYQLASFVYCGTTKPRFTALKKCRPLTTQLGNGLFFLLSLLGKKKKSCYLVGCIANPFNIFYLLLWSFNTAFCHLLECCSCYGLLSVL